MRFLTLTLLLLTLPLPLTCRAQQDRWLYIGRATAEYEPYGGGKYYEVWYADRRTLEYPKPGVIFVWIKAENFPEEGDSQSPLLHELSGESLTANEEFISGLMSQVSYNRLRLEACSRQ